jgi:predicted nucleic acid-binding protein
VIDAAVVDASVAVKWVVQETGSDLARSLSNASLEAPDLLLVECANILWKKVRIGDLTRRDAKRCLDILLRAPVNVITGSELLPQAMDLSCELEHPVYDCLYLAVALRREIPLITADERLARTARKHRKFASRVVLLHELEA